MPVEQRFFGQPWTSASGSNTTKSASQPAASRPLCASHPARRAGPSAIQRAMSDSVNPRRLASVHINGSASERLAMPPQAVWKLPVLEHLHRWRARGMVCGHQVDHPVPEALPQLSRGSRGFEWAARICKASLRRRSSSAAKCK